MPPASVSNTCGRPATYKGRCREHARRREREINRAGRKVYDSKRWRVLRRRKLFEDPLCERCGVLATDVHHRLGVEADPWSLAGLESLCASCHSSHHAAERKKGEGEGIESA